MKMQLELKLKSQGLLERLLKKGDFYFYLLVVFIFSVVFISSDKIDSLGSSLALIALAILTLTFYTFFIHRYYIYTLTLSADYLLIEYRKWFSTKNAQIFFHELEVELKTQYKINFETLVIRGDRIKITQSIQGEWTTELINDMYHRLLEIKNQNTDISYE